MYRVYYRAYQQTIKVTSRFLGWRQPTLLTGENSLRRLPAAITEKGVRRVLIVTDQGIVQLGLMDAFLQQLDQEGISYVIYDQTVPNPTIDNVEQAYVLYRRQGCQGIVAFGGGSPMDCAKGVAARVVRPDKTIPQMKGLLKVRRQMPPFFAIPTTAGTGSEATVAAVISNTQTKEKYAINDTSLIPHVAVHDPLLIVGLPRHITSTTGMDALTHAVEAYIGRNNTAETKACSIEATKIIFQYLYKAYTNGEDLEARERMQYAAYLAGVAFTRAAVGYVHAVAHTLGGFYHMPHGLANAVILPYVLELYGESAHKPLAELAEAVGITGNNDAQKAQRFIAAIRTLNAKMDIPTTVEGIQNRDVPLMVERAYKEANPFYPVPRIFTKDELFYIYQMIQRT